MTKWMQRYFFFIVGLFINSFGIAFITKSALGTSQISSVPYVLSLYISQLSFGMTTFICNMAFILLEVAILQKDFKPVQFLQIVATLFFSVFIDIGMYALSWFQPETLAVRFISLLAGCIILAFGISVEIAPNVLVVPGEGLVRVISQKTKKDFGLIKIYFDVTLIVIASCLSFFFFHGLQGIGIGTIVSAITVGKFVSLINARLPLIAYIQKTSAANRVYAPVRNDLGVSDAQRY